MYRMGLAAIIFLAAREDGIEAIDISSSLIVREAMLLLLFGVVVGMILLLAASRSVQAMLYGVTPTDPATLAFAAMGMIGGRPRGVHSSRPSRVDSRADRDLAGRVTQFCSLLIRRQQSRCVRCFAGNHPNNDVGWFLDASLGTAAADRRQTQTEVTTHARSVRLRTRISSFPAHLFARATQDPKADKWLECGT